MEYDRQKEVGLVLRDWVALPFGLLTAATFWLLIAVGYMYFEGLYCVDAQPGAVCRFPVWVSYGFSYFLMCLVAVVCIAVCFFVAHRSKTGLAMTACILLCWLATRLSLDPQAWFL